MTCLSSLGVIAQKATSVAVWGAGARCGKYNSIENTERWEPCRNDVDFLSVPGDGVFCEPLVVDRMVEQHTVSIYSCIGTELENKG